MDRESGACGLRYPHHLLTPFGEPYRTSIVAFLISKGSPRPGRSLPHSSVLVPIILSCLSTMNHTLSTPSTLALNKLSSSPHPAAHPSLLPLSELADVGVTALLCSWVYFQSHNLERLWLSRIFAHPPPRFMLQDDDSAVITILSPISSLVSATASPSHPVHLIPSIPSRPQNPPTLPLQLATDRNVFTHVLVSCQSTRADHISAISITPLHPSSLGRPREPLTAWHR